MEHVKTLEELIEKLSKETGDNHNLIIACILIVLFNILATGLNIWLQFKLKDKEKSINSFNLKEVSRIKKQEELYSFLDELRYFANGSPAEVQDFLSKIFAINNFITKNGLYLTKHTIEKTNQISDYFLTIISDYTKKDLRREEEIFNEYIDAFNR